MKTCPKCGAEHNKTGKFCSRSCANSRSWTQSDKDAIRAGIFSSEKVKQLHSSMRVNQAEKTCPMCGYSFRLPKSHSEDRTYCSRKCYLDDKDCKYRAASVGGYREGSGRSRSGYYKGIYCGSTYELCWVIHSLDHGVKFTRFDGMIERDGIRYYPDFLLEDGKTIIETKGYEKQTTVNVKTAVAESYGYTVQVLRKEDLKFAFDYVERQYGTKKFDTLYDNYKPKFTYICHHCSSEFTKDRKIKTDVVFCSRTCCGKGHLGRVKTR